MLLTQAQVEELLLVLTLALLSATSEQLQSDIRSWISLLATQAK